MAEEIINLKDYFIHHYDDWGRLYCVEFKGDPLKLEDSIKRLKQENEELKENSSDMQRIIAELQYKIHNNKYKSALEEINLILDELKQQYDYMADYSEIKEIQDKINEVLQ